MDLTFLPEKLYNCISKCNINSITEIRIRNGYKVRLKVGNKLYYLSNDGLTLLENQGVKCDYNDIQYIINNVTEHSIYAFNDKIKNGYLSTKDGIRLGLAGECVTDNEKVLTIKNFNSINVRIPHEIIGCSDKIFDYIYQSKIYNTIIISPPLFGKTTILKDLIRKLNLLNTETILVVDERGEFNHIKGENVDYICYSSKKFAFENGIRVLSPNIIIADELVDESDWECVKKASLSGIKIIASCHGSSLNDIINRACYKNKVFERFVVLKSCGQAGVIDKVYDQNYREL